MCICMQVYAACINECMSSYTCRDASSLCTFHAIYCSLVSLCNPYMNACNQLVLSTGKVVLAPPFIDENVTWSRKLYIYL